jgi:hypothetical protein
MEIELTPRDGELSVSVSIDRLYNELGEQGILGEDVEDSDFFYLAALALECYEDEDYDLEDVILEVLRVTERASLEEADEIEAILR